MSSRSVLLRGGSWNSAAQLAPLLVNLALTPFVIHGLGVSRFGLYILATSITDFLGTFDGGLYSAAQRYFAVHAGAKDRQATGRLYLSLTVGVSAFGVVLWGVLTACAPLLIVAFRIPSDLRSEGRFMLQILGIVLALQILRGVFAALLNANQRFALTSLATVGQYALYTVGIVLTVHEGWGLYGVALTLLIQTAAVTAALAYGSSRYVTRARLRFLRRRELSDFLKYAGRAQVASFSDLINLQSDSVIIGGFLGVRSVTFYSSGRNFASQIRTFPGNAIGPAATLLGETFGKDGQSAVLVQFRRLQRIWVRACSGWIAVAAGAAWFGVTKWLGSDFELAGTVAVVLLVGYMFRLWADMLTVYCQTVGHPELEARYGTLSVAVNLVLTLALVVPFGVIGVIVATAIGQLTGSLYLINLVHRRLSPEVPSFLGEVPWRLMAATAALTVALEALARPWLTEGPIGLVEAGLVASPALAVYVIGMFGWSTLVARARQLWRRPPTEQPAEPTQSPV